MNVGYFVILHKLLIRLALPLLSLSSYHVSIEFERTKMQREYEHSEIKLFSPTNALKMDTDEVFGLVQLQFQTVAALCIQRMSVSMCVCLYYKFEYYPKRKRERTQC